MAILIGLVVGLFILLALTLLGAGLRNPRWLFVGFCLILVLYKYGENQLANDVENLSISVSGQPNGCPVGQVHVRLTNGDTRRIERFGFELRGFLPNHSNRSAYQYLRSDRIIPAGQSWANCWRVAELGDLPVSQHGRLRWEAEITSVGFAE